MSDQSDPNDSRGESLSTTTRRGALAALGLGGLAALGSGSTTASIGGGPDSDAMSDHRVPFYRVSEADLDSPGVVGRRVEITSGGATYETGDQLVDSGTSWELIDAGYGSVNAEQAGINDPETGDSIDVAPGATYTVTRKGGNYFVYDGSKIVHSEEGEHTFHNVLDWIGTEQDNANESFVVHIDDGVYSFGNSVDWSFIPSWAIVGSDKTIFSCDPNSSFDATASNFQFYAGGQDHITLKNITFDNNGSGAAEAFTTVGGETKFNRVVGCDVTGDYDGGTLIDISAWTYADIRGNHIYNVGADVRGIGVRQNDGTFVNISNNIVENLGWNGIILYGESEWATISANIVRNCGHSPIALSPAQKTTIVGNVVEGAPSDGEFEGGIELEYKHKTGRTTKYVTCIGNVVDNCDKGIFVTDRVEDTDSSPPSHLNIGYNVITNCGEGVHILHANPPVNVDRNIFDGNTTDLAVNSGVSDVSIQGDYDLGTLSITNNGTRTRWNGVIGGGPLGGVDLSSTTGQFDGDLAVADGTSGAAAGAWARWDESASNWQYVDPTGTV